MWLNFSLIFFTLWCIFLHADAWDCPLVMFFWGSNKYQDASVKTLALYWQARQLRRLGTLVLWYFGTLALSWQARRLRRLGTLLLFHPILSSLAEGAWEKYIFANLPEMV
jgi:hypothetical protein